MNSEKSKVSEKQEIPVERVERSVDEKNEFPWSPSSLADNGDSRQKPASWDDGEHNF